MPPSSCQSLRSVPVSSHPAPGNPLGTPQQMLDGFGSQLWKRLQNRRGEAFGLQLQQHQRLGLSPNALSHRPTLQEITRVTTKVLPARACRRIQRAAGPWRGPRRQRQQGSKIQPLVCPLVQPFFSLDQESGSAEGLPRRRSRQPSSPAR